MRYIGPSRRLNVTFLSKKSVKMFKHTKQLINCQTWGQTRNFSQNSRENGKLFERLFQPRMWNHKKFVILSSLFGGLGSYFGYKYYLKNNELSAASPIGNNALLFQKKVTPFCFRTPRQVQFYRRCCFTLCTFSCFH